VLHSETSVARADGVMRQKGGCFDQIRATSKEISTFPPNTAATTKTIMNAILAFRAARHTAPRRSTGKRRPVRVGSLSGVGSSCVRATPHWLWRFLSGDPRCLGWSVRGDSDARGIRGGWPRRNGRGSNSDSRAGSLTSFRGPHPGRSEKISITWAIHRFCVGGTTDEQIILVLMGSLNTEPYFPSTRILLDGLRRLLLMDVLHWR